MAEDVKFYAVRGLNGEWEIWDKTIREMTALTNQDRFLGKRMADHAPFNTRSEAEIWIADMRKRGL